MIATYVKISKMINRVYLWKSENSLNSSFLWFILKNYNKDKKNENFELLVIQSEFRLALDTDHIFNLEMSYAFNLII